MEVANLPVQSPLLRASAHLRKVLNAEGLTEQEQIEIKDFAQRAFDLHEQLKFKRED